MNGLRSVFLQVLFSKHGLYYRWDGKGPLVFDCSGLYSFGLAAVGRVDDVLRLSMNCKAIWAAFPHVTDPKPGDGVLYGPDPSSPNHIMTFIGDGRVYGACGGDSGTTNDLIAAAQNAKVQWRDEVNYRKNKDLLGYVRSPLD